MRIAVQPTGIGIISWLTPAEGGRKTGPPVITIGNDVYFASYRSHAARALNAEPGQLCSIDIPSEACAVIEPIEKFSESAWHVKFVLDIPDIIVPSLKEDDVLDILEGSRIVAYLKVSKLT